MPQILSTGAKCNAHAKEYVVFGARSGFLVSFPWMAGRPQPVRFAWRRSQSNAPESFKKMQIKMSEFSKLQKHS